MTQPVMIQSFTDEFKMSNDTPELRASPETVSTNDDGSLMLTKADASIYRSGVGKLLHMLVKGNRNQAQELSQITFLSTTTHLKAMCRVINYVKNTSTDGNFICPSTKFEFITSRRPDSEYAADPEACCIVSGATTFLCGAPVITKSHIQKCVILSVMEAEFVSACEIVQGMSAIHHESP